MAVRLRTPADGLDWRWVPIGDVKPDPQNTRRHTRRNLEAIEESLRRWGQQRPLVVDQGLVTVAGNGTLTVMKRLGFQRICISVFPGTAAEARAYGIADNRTGELATTNQALLLEHLERMDMGLLAAAGYHPEELDDLLAAARPPSTGASLEPDRDFELPGDDGDDMLGDYFERYGSKAVWTLQYDYPNELFLWLVDQLRAYREAHGLETNVEAITAIAAELSGETPPAAG